MSTTRSVPCRGWPLLPVVVALFGISLLTVLPASPAAASTTNTRADAWGALELSGSSWLGGNGVDVYSNGPSVNGPSPDTYKYVTNKNGVSTQTGIEWQCVELVNRLYLTRGWITSTWYGNGNQLYANTPAGLTKEPNGSITYLNPGDVVTLDDGGLGHAGIIASVTGSSVQIVNQNTTAVFSSATFVNHQLTMTGWSGYTVQGVIHAPTSGGGTQPPATDDDADGTPNTTDYCAEIPGVVYNRGCPIDGHTVTGNFYGSDGYTDALTFYDYGNANLGAFVSAGGPTGMGQPQYLWNTGTGQWSWGTSTFLAGNFSGNDSYTDVIGLYDYGNGRLGAFLLPGTSSGVGQPQWLWTTNANGWNLGSAKYVVGNFSGSDGHDDILAFYDYGSANMGVLVLPGTGAGVGQPQAQWTTGPGGWYVQNAQYVVGNFAGNDSYTDVLAYYQYADNNMGVFLFPGSSGNLGQPQLLWTTGAGGWNVTSARFLAGNFAGGDAYTDVVALYDYGNANLGAFVFAGTGTGVAQPQALWTTGAGQWYLTNGKIVAGYFGGSASGLFAWYDYGNSNTGGQLFPTATSGVQLPQGKWTTGPGQWTWACM